MENQQEIVLSDCPIEALAEDLVSYRDLADLLRTPINTLRGWVRRGQIPHYKNGGWVRFSKREILEWIERHKVKEVTYGSIRALR